MNYYFVLQCDKWGAEDIRNTYHDAHMAYMESFNDHFMVGGATFVDDSHTTANGSGYVIGFDTLVEFNTFLANDPYMINGLYEFTIARPWVKMMPKT